MRTWTGPQVRRFLALAEGDRYHPALAFLALTGCRRGGVLGLRWADVDLDRATAAIRQTVIPLTKPGGKGREGRIIPRTKTDRARVIELDAATVAMLKTWNHGLIFCRPDGRPYHPEAFSKTFDRRFGQPSFAVLPRIRLHDLRHTWATLALIAGVDIRMVSERLGHSNILITSNTYQHVIKGMQAGAAQKVADLIFGPRT
jgi:integrase